MMLSNFIWFASTFFVVSITPGMCMMLSLSLGMSIGVRDTLNMMWGELLGVGLVAASAAIGVAAILLKWPNTFDTLKLLGGVYIAWLGFELCRSKGRLAIPENQTDIQKSSPFALALQGFITAIINPKAWAFFVTLIPPFLEPSKALAPQLAFMILIILIIEFGCLIAYASGGQMLKGILMNRGQVKLLNRIAGGLLLLVGVWLAAF